MRTDCRHPRDAAPPPGRPSVEEMETRVAWGERVDAAARATARAEARAAVKAIERAAAPPRRAAPAPQPTPATLPAVRPPIAPPAPPEVETDPTDLIVAWTTFRLALGNAIRRRRVKLGLTLTDLAALTGISKSYLCLIETGACSPPTESKIRCIAGQLGLDADDIIARGQLAKVPAALWPRLRALLQEDAPIGKLLSPNIAQATPPADREGVPPCQA